MNAPTPLELLSAIQAQMHALEERLRDSQGDVDPLLTNTEARERSRYSKAAWGRMRASGEGPPCYQRGHKGKIRYKLSDLDAWIESSKRSVPFPLKGNE